MNTTIYKILFILLSINAFSQEVLVLDSLNKEPVAFTNYYLKKNSEIVNSGYCNERGIFSISKGIDFQTISLTCVGYESKTLNSSDLKDTIFLKRSIVSLSEVVIPNSHVIKLLGNSELKRKASLSASKGMEIAVFIDNPFRLEKKIHSFLLKIKNKQDLSTGIRVHLYSKDSLTNMPNEELLTENIVYILKNNKSEFEIDVKDKGIVFPKEGCFIGIEWLGILDESTGFFSDDLANWNGTYVELNDSKNTSDTYFRNGINNQNWRDMEDFKNQVASFTHFKNYPNASFGFKYFE